MLQGQKVVCINDTFADFLRAIYARLPVKGTTYTIREVFLGRGKILHGGEAATVGLLLEELHNPPILFMPVSKSLVFPRKGSPSLKS